MNIRMTEKFVNISRHVNDPKLEGFYMESFGNCITARRINSKQFDVITESYLGTENLYPAQDVDAVLNRVADMLEMDELAEYIAHFATATVDMAAEALSKGDIQEFFKYAPIEWPKNLEDKFMNMMCCKLCHPGFYGFQMTGKRRYTLSSVRSNSDSREASFKVHRHSNRMEWVCNDEVTDFAGVVRKLRESLNGDFMWFNYAKL